MHSKGYQKIRRTTSPNTAPNTFVLLFGMVALEKYEAVLYRNLSQMAPLSCLTLVRLCPLYKLTIQVSKISSDPWMNDFFREMDL